MKYIGNAIASKIIFHDKSYNKFCEMEDITTNQLVSCGAFVGSASNEYEALHSMFPEILYFQISFDDDESDCNGYIDTSCDLDILGTISMQCEYLQVMEYVDIENGRCYQETLPMSPMAYVANDKDPGTYWLARSEQSDSSDSVGHRRRRRRRLQFESNMNSLNSLGSSDLSDLKGMSLINMGAATWCFSETSSESADEPGDELDATNNGSGGLSEGESADNSAASSHSSADTSDSSGDQSVKSMAASLDSDESAYSGSVQIKYYHQKSESKGSAQSADSIDSMSAESDSDSDDGDDGDKTENTVCLTYRIRDFRDGECGSLDSVLLPLCPDSTFIGEDDIDGDDLNDRIISIKPDGVSQGVDEEILGILISFDGAPPDIFELCLKDVIIQSTDVGEVDIPDFASLEVDGETADCRNSDGLPCLS